MTSTIQYECDSSEDKRFLTWTGIPGSRQPGSISPRLRVRGCSCRAACFAWLGTQTAMHRYAHHRAAACFQMMLWHHRAAQPNLGGSQLESQRGTAVRPSSFCSAATKKIRRDSRPKATAPVQAPSDAHGGHMQLWLLAIRTPASNLHALHPRPAPTPTPRIMIGSHARICTRPSAPDGFLCIRSANLLQVGLQKRHDRHVWDLDAL